MENLTLDLPNTSLTALEKFCEAMLKQDGRSLQIVNNPQHEF